MDIFEQADVLYPSRTEAQDEEEQGLLTAKANLQSPIILWNEDTKSLLYPKGVKPNILVISTCPVSCALLQHAVAGQQAIGTVVLPEMSLDGNPARRGLGRSCHIYTAGDDAAVIIVVCSVPVSDNRATALARALNSAIQPRKVLVMGSMSAEQYFGPGDPSQEVMLYTVQTDAARLQSAQASATQLPLLPTGNIVRGLPAALLAQYQVRSVPAHLLVLVEMVAGTSPHSIKPLAQACCRVLQDTCELATDYRLVVSLQSAATHGAATKQLLQSLAAHSSHVYI